MPPVQTGSQNPSLHNSLLIFDLNLHSAKWGVAGSWQQDTSDFDGQQKVTNKHDRAPEGKCVLPLFL